MAYFPGDADWSVYHPYNFSPDDHWQIHHDYMTEDMRGGGMNGGKFRVRDAISVGKKLVSGDLDGAARDVVVPVLKQGLASVTNLFQNKENPLSTPTYPGEIRMPMKGEYAPEPFKGKRMLANYAGPGTHFLKRIKLGHQPVSLLDRISQAHDARYSLATTAEDVRKADLIFMQRIEKEKNNLNPMEYHIVKKAFEAKMAAEDHKLARTREAVLTQNVEDGYSNEDRKLMEGVLGTLIQKGEGKKDSEISPATRLARTMQTIGDVLHPEKTIDNDPSISKKKARLLRTAGDIEQAVLHPMITLGTMTDKAIAKMKKKKGKGLEPAGGALKLAGQGRRGVIPFLMRGRKLHRLFVDHIRKYRPQLTPSDETHIEDVVDANFPPVLSKVGEAVKKIALKLHDHFGLPNAPLPDAAAVQEVTDQAVAELNVAGQGFKSQLKKIGKKAVGKVKSSASRLASDAKTSAAQIASETASSLSNLAQQQIDSAASHATGQLQNLDNRISNIVQRGLA
jgi:hypothetical protein